MAKEIERKFLVKGDAWKKAAKGIEYRQGYLSSVKERVVRVRTIEKKGFLTIKGITKGVSRSEFEYEISVEDANIMLDDICEKPLIEKKRYKIMIGTLVFEVDEFFGENAGPGRGRGRAQGREAEDRTSRLDRRRGFRRSPLLQFQPDQAPVHEMVSREPGAGKHGG